MFSAQHSAEERKKLLVGCLCFRHPPDAFESLDTVVPLRVALTRVGDYASVRGDETPTPLFCFVLVDLEARRRYV